MSDYVIPEPEPKEIDETLSMELRHLSENAVLKGRPSGEEKCENCRYYLEPTADLSYCWHPKLRILVGAQWWCQWWDADSRRFVAHSAHVRRATTVYISMSP